MCSLARIHGCGQELHIGTVPHPVTRLQHVPPLRMPAAEAAVAPTLPLSLAARSATKLPGTNRCACCATAMTPASATTAPLSRPTSSTPAYLATTPTPRASVRGCAVQRLLWVDVQCLASGRLGRSWRRCSPCPAMLAGSRCCSGGDTSVAPGTAWRHALHLACLATAVPGHRL